MYPYPWASVARPTKSFSTIPNSNKNTLKAQTVTDSRAHHVHQVDRVVLHGTKTVNGFIVGGHLCIRRRLFVVDQLGRGHYEVSAAKKEGAFSIHELAADPTARLSSLRRHKPKVEELPEVDVERA